MAFAIIAEKVNKYFIDNEKQTFAHLWRAPTDSEKFHSVRDISFRVSRGETFGILGPNGCGKSTLIRMISTLIIPDSGRIEVLGHDVVKGSRTIRKLIGRVSVDASFFMKLSALENLDYSAGLYSLDRTKASIRSRMILAELGFPKDKLSTSVEKLSRGQQQKIAIARGFLAKPKVLLLDEPTTGLDPVSKLDVQRFIRKEMERSDVTVVITSHDMEEVDKLCDRLMIMDKGRMIAKGTAAELKHSNSVEGTFELKTLDQRKAVAVLKRLEGISDPRAEGERIIFRCDCSVCAAQSIVQALDDNDIGFVSMGRLIPTLEDVFVKLTGERLKDG